MREGDGGFVVYINDWMKGGCMLMQHDKIIACASLQLKNYSKPIISYNNFYIQTLEILLVR